MAIIMIYENSGKDKRTGYRVLSCFVYTLVDNYVCIAYLKCQSKTLFVIPSNPKFEETSFIYYLVLAFHNCYLIWYLFMDS